MNHAEFLQLSDERDQWLARILAAERYGYQRGHADGIEQGRRDALDAVAAQVQAACDHLRPVLRSRRPDDTQMTIRRYAPPGWTGTIPAGMTGPLLRRWLAALPRDSDHPAGRRTA